MSEIVDIFDIELEFDLYPDDFITVDGITSERYRPGDLGTEEEANVVRPMFELLDDHDSKNCAFCVSGNDIDLANSERMQPSIANAKLFLDQ